MPENDNQEVPPTTIVVDPEPVVNDPIYPWEESPYETYPDTYEEKSDDEDNNDTDE